MKVMLDMVHPRVYSVHVCLLSHYVGRCSNLQVYGTNLFEIVYSVKGISYLNLSEHLDILI